MKNPYRFTTPRRALTGRKLDNLALVPGNLLPHKTDYQRLANGLPTDAILIVLPQNNAWQKHTLLLVAKLLAQPEHQVRVLSEAETTRRRAHLG